MNLPSDRLRHIATLLERWRGFTASLWSIRVPHASLTIRVEREDSNHFLEIACLGPISIHAPFAWKNSCIAVDREVGGIYRLHDARNDVNIRMDAIEVKEH